MFSLKSALAESAFGIFVHALTKGKVFPGHEERPEYQVPERFMPGYKSQLASEQGRARSHEPVQQQQQPRRTASQESTPAQTPRRSSTETVDDSGDPSPRQSGLGEKARQSSSGSVECPPELGDHDDAYLVTWDDNDPENPQNWSRGRKALATVMLCLLTTSVYMGSSIYSPGVELFAQWFGIGTVPATLGLTLFVIGYGLGPMFGLSSMSEVPSIGRAPPYVVTLFIFVILQIPTALVKNVAGFMILRFLAGIAGSPALATGGASLGDMFAPQKLPLLIGVWGLSGVCGPVLGPLIGGFASQSFGAEGWRWTIWPLLMLCGFTLIILVLFMPETSAATILAKRAKRLRKRTGNPHLRSMSELEQAAMTPKELALMTFVRPFVLSFREPIVLSINLHIGLVYGILYLWFEAFPLVFVNVYGFNYGEMGLAFFGIMVGAVIAYGLFALWHKVYYMRLWEETGGKVPPEQRLWPAIFGAFCIPICMFGFGWTATASIHWMVPIVFSAFFGIGTFLLFQSGLGYLGDAYPRYIASVFAGNDFARAMIGGALPLVARAMFTNLQSNGPAAFPVSWGSVLIGCISIAMIPIPIALYLYGAKLRSWSKYCESSDDLDRREQQQSSTKQSPNDEGQQQQPQEKQT